jgi:hypothetical protein
MSYTINELKAQAEELLTEFKAGIDERDKLIQTRQEAAKKEVEATYNPRLQQLLDKYTAIKMILDNDKISTALDGKNAPAPLDAILIEWRHPTMGRSGCPIPGSKLQPSGRRGRLEVVTEKTVWPTKGPSYTPPVGSYIIRLLSASGKPMKSALQFGLFGNNELPVGWYVQGYDPNVSGVRPVPQIKI